MSRHLRQESFPAIGPAGQAKLRASRVLIVGLGALGTHHAETLARAGVGTLTLIDRDLIELSNLQRQGLYATSDVGRPKALVAAEKLLAIDPGLTVNAHAEEFTPGNALELARAHDLILDGTDNFEARFLINEAALSAGIPWVMAAVVASYGQLQPVLPKLTACLACLMEEIPSAPGPTCETAGVIGPAVTMVSALATGEALKILTGALEAVSGPLFFDLWLNQFHRMNPARPRPDCAVCSLGQRPLLDGELRTVEAVRYCGTRTVQIRPPKALSVDLAELARTLPARYRAELADGLLRLREGESELVIFPGGRALVREVDSAETARRLYAQVLGV